MHGVHQACQTHKGHLGELKFLNDQEWLGAQIILVLCNISLSNETQSIY